MKKTLKTSFVALLRYILNLTISIFWSIIGFGPIGYFCYNYMFNNWFYIFLGLSLTGLILPAFLLNKLMISRSAVFYREAGLKFVQNFTQDGVWVNKIFRTKLPVRDAEQSKKILKNHLEKGYMNEKFHLMMFIFFLLCTGYALIIHQYLWSVAITSTNVLFNVYPILLQQYNRLRLTKLIARYSDKKEG